MTFAGQGSQYEGMLRDLVETRAEARSAMREFDALLAGSGFPSFADMAWAKSENLGSDLLQTQLGVLGADFMLFRCVLAMGCVPDVVVGHSYGEYAALVAAGCITLEQAIRITRERTVLIERHPATQGSLLAVGAGTEDILALGAKCSLAIHIAICNGTERTAVGGTQDALDEFARICDRNGVPARPLAVPRPFHTPLLEPVRAAFREILEKEQFRPPRVPFLANVHSRYLSDPSDIRDHLAEQLVTTIHYRETIERLIGEGDDLALVEIGPRQILTGLHRPYVSGTVKAYATDHPTKGAEYLARLSVLADSTPEPPYQSTPEIVFFDATEGRRAKNRGPRSAILPHADADDGMAKLLIEFVCEQTGYPAEIVDLDADLEADLGIDSIKKARLLGELRNRNLLTIQLDRTLKLQDFPTLRSILQLLQSAGSDVRKNSIVSRQPEPQVHQAHERRLTLKGSAYEMGLQQARQLGPNIQSLLKRYHEALGQPDLETPEILQLPERGQEHLGTAGFDEIRGLADGLAIPVHHLLAFNAAQEARFQAGCAQMAIRRGQNILHGANEDTGFAMLPGDPLTPIAQTRWPKGGIPHILFSIPGRIGALNGINRAGLAITSAILMDRPASESAARGWFPPALVGHLLESAASFDEAIQIIQAADRCRAWSMVLSHRDQDHFVHIEYDSRRVEVRRVESVSATNHSLLLDGRLEAPGHSIHRLERLQQLQSDCAEAEDARAALRDQFDLARNRVSAHATMNTVRRVDNLYSAVFSPRTGDIWWTYGKDGEERTERLSLAALDQELEAQDGQNKRYILRPVDSALFSNSESHSMHSSVCVSKRNSLGKELSGLLDARGVQLVNSTRDLPRHLILTEGREDAERPFASVLDTYWMCQDWIRRLSSSGQLAGSSLTAVTSLGGDFGLSGRISNVLGGGLAGLLKAIQKEYPQLRVKVIDAPSHEPRLAEFVLRELSCSSAELEIASVQGRRRVIQAIQEDAVARQTSGITAGTNWVVSGGARGITALVARELGRRYKLRLHLIGTTVLDKGATSKAEEVRGTLAALAAEGITASYYPCDVTQKEQLATVLDNIRCTGPICGILHGAGFEAAGSFLRKSEDQVKKTIESKVKGVQNLIELTMADPLSHFLAFGSISGRFGVTGQTDYSLASELLAKVVQRYRRQRPEIASATFHWPAWDTVGMAMRPETRLVIDISGHKVLRAEDGIRHFIAELEAGVPEGEVLITAASNDLDLKHNLPLKFRELISPMHVTDRILSIEPGTLLETEVVLHPSRQDFLKDHVWRGANILPAAASAVAMLEAARLCDPGQESPCLCDFVVMNPLRVGAEPVAIKTLAATEQGSIYCEIVSEFYNSKGRLVDARWKLASGRIETRPTAQTASLPPVDPAASEWKPVRYPTNEEAASQDTVFLGPTMQCLREVAPLPGGIAGRIIAPASEGMLHPAFLDACFVTGGIYCLLGLHANTLALGFGTLQVTRVPLSGERCLVNSTYRGLENNLYSFDLAVFGENGESILSVAKCDLVGTESGSA
jgi:malonyl CoA-acyl carrier protein transacylase/acyl carrier protein/NADP-dependent 3-hydroxy acid dehydrogenase YdfG